MYNILIVDDERTARKGLYFILQSLNLRLDEADSKAAAQQLLQSRTYDLAIVDLRLPYEAQGLALIKAIRQQHPLTPVLVMTAFGSIESAIKAIKAGAQDFITKDFSQEEICLKVEQLLETRRLWQANLRLSAQVNSLQKNSQHLDAQDQIVGDSLAIRQVLDLTLRAGQDNDSTVLITGESGTGKELIARSIHVNSSSRRQQNFVVIDVANMPPTLLESQLFGHEKGAFTNALQQHIGLFETANRGTVFLDEIGDFPMELQVKLLRFLQEKKFYRVGGTRPIQVDVRIIAATNKNLEEAVRQKRFREDLFYRLNVVRIALPALRERLQDLPVLIAYFCRKLESQKGRCLIFPEAVIQKMQNYDWPGNVRQLKNFLERLFITCPGEKVDETDLIFETVPETDWREFELFAPLLKLPFKVARRQLIEKFEKIFLRNQLQANQGNISKIAAEVGESREGLSKKIKRYGLKGNENCLS